MSFSCAPLTRSTSITNSLRRFELLSVWEIPSSFMMSMAASLGLSLLWDTEVGLSHIFCYLLVVQHYTLVSVGQFNNNKISCLSGMLIWLRHIMVHLKTRLDH